MKITLKPVSDKINVLKTDDVELVFSYSTPVGAWVSGQGYFKTDASYSRTTTKHINEMGYKNEAVKPQAFFDDLAKKIGTACPEASNITSVKFPHAEVIFSYSTPVCAWVYGQGKFRTDEFFSNTTSKHIGKMGFRDATKKPQAFFDALLQILPPAVDQQKLTAQVAGEFWQPTMADLLAA